MLPDLKTYRTEFLENFNGSPNTYKQYDYSSNYLVKCLGPSFKLHEFTRKHVDKYQQFLLKHFNSLQSVHRYLGYAKTIWNRYWDTYKHDIYDLDPKYALLRTNPFKGVIKTNLPHTKSKLYLSDYEFDKLFYAAARLPIYDNEQLCDLIYVYRYLGLRRGESLLIRKSDVRGDHVIVTEEKDGPGQKRIIPLFGEVKDILYNRCLGKEEEDFIFDYNVNTLYKHVKDAVKSAELNPIVTIQSLRVTFGSHLIAVKKIPISKVAQWMGHASVSMTERFYSDLLERDHKYWIEQVSNKQQVEEF